MADSCLCSRMKRLFTSYVSALLRNGLSWIMQDSRGLAVKHFVSAFQPKALQELLQTDLELTYSSHNNNLKDLMKHATTIAEAFQVIDNDPPSSFCTPQSWVGSSKSEKRLPNLVVVLPLHLLLHLEYLQKLLENHHPSAPTLSAQRPKRATGSMTAANLQMKRRLHSKQRSDLNSPRGKRPMDLAKPQDLREPGLIESKKQP